MKFDVYGQFKMEVAREGDAWVAYLIEPGKRMKIPELGIPSVLEPSEIPLFLDDLYHEKSRLGQRVREL